jgi:hypothetical protein
MRRPLAVSLCFKTRDLHFPVRKRFSQRIIRESSLAKSDVQTKTSPIELNPSHT